MTGVQTCALPICRSRGPGGRGRGRGVEEGKGRGRGRKPPPIGPRANPAAQSAGEGPWEGEEALSRRAQGQSRRTERWGRAWQEQLPCISRRRPALDLEGAGQVAAANAGGWGGSQRPWKARCSGSPIAEPSRVPVASLPPPWALAALIQVQPGSVPSKGAPASAPLMSTEGPSASTPSRPQCLSPHLDQPLPDQGAGYGDHVFKPGLSQETLGVCWGCRQLCPHPARWLSSLRLSFPI